MIGKAETYLRRDSAHTRRVGIIGTGTVLYHALIAGKTLNERGVGASVMHMATIKPLDEKSIRAFAEEHDVIVTVEEHQVAGGLGSAVAEFLSSVRPTRILRLGVHDQFGQSGTPEELLRHYGIDHESIVRETQRFLAL
jgi:transketolase